MTHAAAAGTAEGEAGRRLACRQRIEVPSDGRRGLSGTWASRNAKDTAQGDRAQRRHRESTGSFHMLLSQVLSGNRSAPTPGWPANAMRSEEHTSELQSLAYLVCRLLLEKKK